MSLKKLGIAIGILGMLSFLVLTTLAMYYYPGGTLHERGTIGYSFFTNFFSDLGRTVALNREDNSMSYFLFKSAMYSTGFSMLIFLLVVPFLFKNNVARVWSILALVAGIGAAFCYIGIAENPLNGSYWAHRFYVRTGFVAFLTCVIFYILAIRNDEVYPNRYANIMVVFSLVLLLQILIMLLGPRSWQSPAALWLQVVSQKIIVYGQIFCMLIQAFGAWRVVNKTQELNSFSS